MPTTTTGIATEFIQFTRASNATVTDSDGKVKWVPHNLLLNSESFDTSSWTKTTTTVAANSIAAPNGTTTANTLAASGANGTTLQTFTAEAISYTFAVWLKRKTGTGNIQIAADSGTYTTVTITSDWALYTVTQTPAAGSKSAGIRIVTSADEVYAWGASLYRSDLAMQPNTSAYPMYNPTTPKNLLGYTESLTTGWTNSNTTDAIVSEVNPVGLTGAVDVAATAGNGTLLGSLSLLASPYTFSIWLKRKTGSGTVEITVDGTTYVAAAVTGTWTRFSTTLTPTAGTKTPGIRLVTSGDAVYAWGAQLSDSASLDPYVPVYGAAVTSAAYYGPRRDFDGATLACKGLLVEEQRANLVLQSAAFDNASWQKNNLNTTGTPQWVNAATAPDGTMTADKFIPNTTSVDTHLIQSAAAITVANTTAHTWSVYAKADGYNWIGVDAYNNGQSNFTWFNVATGAIGTNAVGNTAAPPVAVGNGWYRLSVTRTTANTVAYYILYAANADNKPTFAGDGTSGIFVYGAQLEANASFATSYIPTGAATATRNADVASVSTQAFPYSASEGTLVGAYSLIAASGTQYITALGVDSNNQIYMIGNNGAGSRDAVVITSGTGQGFNPIAGAVASSAVKQGFAFAANNTAHVVGGGSPVTDATVTMPPAANILNLGSTLTGFNSINGHIRQITYLPRRISNAELQTRTT